MRQPVTLKIKFKSASLDQFIERYSVDVSRGGIFIRTKEPLQVGTQLKFEFQLQDSSALISGEGTVVWIREHDPSRTGVAPGMGVRFDKLATTSGGVLDQILVEKTKRGEAQVESRFDAGVRATSTASGSTTQKRASDFEQADSKALTPLPNPMPGLDGPEEEFGQESTRVMQDDVVARLAEKTRKQEEAFPDEPTRARSAEELDVLAKASSPDAADEQLERTAVRPRPPSVITSAVAPDLSVPLPAAAKAPQMPTRNTPAPMPAIAPAVAPVAAAPVAAAPVAAAPVADPAPVAATPEPITPASPVATALPARTDDRDVIGDRPPTRKKSSPVPAILGLGVIAASVIGYLVFTSGPSSNTKPPEPGVVTPPPVAKAPEPVAKAPEPVAKAPEPVAKAPEPVVKAPEQGPSVAVSSTPAGAIVTVNGTAQAEPTPTTLTGLDPKKSYDVRVAMKGYRDFSAKLTPKEGAKLEAKLVANERVVELTSTPAGADVILDGKKIGRTPFTMRKVDVAKDHALELRHAGYVAQTHNISAGDAWEPKGEGRDVLALALTLEAEAPKARPVVAAVRHPAPGKPAATPAAKPAGETPAAEKPATTPVEAAEKPVAEKPAEKPVAEKPAEKPAAEKPAEKPAAEKPAVEKDTEEKNIKVPAWMKKKAPADKPAEKTDEPAGEAAPAQ